MKFFSFTGALMCLLILLNINRAYAQVSVITSIQGASVVCLPVNSTMNYSVSASNAPTSYSWSYTGPSGGIIINNPTASSTSISYQLPFANNTYTLHCYAINSFGNSSVVAFVMHVLKRRLLLFQALRVFVREHLLISPLALLFFRQAPQLFRTAGLQLPD